MAYDMDGDIFPDEFAPRPVRECTREDDGKKSPAKKTEKAGEYQLVQSQIPNPVLYIQYPQYTDNSRIDLQRNFGDIAGVHGAANPEEEEEDEQEEEDEEEEEEEEAQH
jgi:hypothetical protein